MTRYAAKTTVPVSRSRAELEGVLARYGATAFGYGYDEDRAVVTFRIADRHIRFDLSIPADPQHERQRWRALVLVVKAKLEAIESGLATVEQEFLANVMLPSGETVGQWAGPQLAATYATGEMPTILPGAPARALPPGGGAHA